MLAGSPTGTVLRAFREGSATASCAVDLHGRLGEGQEQRDIFTSLFQLPQSQHVNDPTPAP